MDDRRAAHTLTDAALDRELERVLRVEPSPEFMARVRTRIAEEPPPSTWRFGWFAVAIAAAAAMLIAAAVVNRKPATTVTPPSLLVARALATAAPTFQLAESGLRRDDGARVPPVRHGSATVSETGTVASERSVVPEVLIDPRESRALRALIAGVRAGRIDLSEVARASAPDPMNLPPLADLEIPPIAIDPLAPDAGAQGERP